MSLEIIITNLTIRKSDKFKFGAIEFELASKNKEKVNEAVMGAVEEVIRGYYHYYNKLVGEKLRLDYTGTKSQNSVRIMEQTLVKGKDGDTYIRIECNLFKEHKYHQIQISAIGPGYRFYKKLKRKITSGQFAKDITAKLEELLPPLNPINVKYQK